MSSLNLLFWHLAIQIWRGSNSNGRDGVVNHRVSFVEPLDIECVVAFRHAISLRWAYDAVILILKGQRHVTLRYRLA